MATKKATRKMPRVEELYVNTVREQLKKDLKLDNINAVPKLEKIVLNMGLGDVKDNSKSFNATVDELALISGQKPYVTTAKKSISNFKVREQQKIGAKVTLRGEKMYEFFDRLVSIVIPRIRDFDGLSTKSFDGRGNYNFGIKEQLLFPEISYEKIEKIRGLDICLVTTANTNEGAQALLSALGMPFERKED